MDERTPSPEDWARLAREVKQRRVQLAMTQQQVAADGGPSVSILTKIETAKKSDYEAMVIARLERALRWRTGSVDAILAGKPPLETPTESPSTGRRPYSPQTSPSAADAIGVEKILAILEVQGREIAELRERDAERQAEMQRLSEEIDRRHARGDTGHDRRKGA